MSVFSSTGPAARLRDVGDPSTVAVVESPAQLLNVIEWAWSGRARTTDTKGALSRSGGPRGADQLERFGAGMSICILAPGESEPRRQLSAISQMARGVGFAVTWLDVRGGADARLRALPGLARIVRQARTLVVGDPFSGALQLLLTASNPETVVVVDDGSATIEFAKLIGSGAGLLRWHSQQGASLVKRQLATTATRRLTSRVNGFELFTAMPVDPAGLPARVRVRRNRFGWIRHAFGPPQVRSGADLIGTSLTESGVVSGPHYLKAVADLARANRVDRYLAHRRESAEKLGVIAELGLEIVRPELPLEIVLRQGPMGSTLISFPSTVVHTLPVVLAGSDVTLLTCDIDQQWFTGAHASGAQADQFLSGMTATAREHHGLATVAA